MSDFTISTKQSRFRTLIVISAALVAVGFALSFIAYWTRSPILHLFTWGYLSVLFISAAFAAILTLGLGVLAQVWGLIVATVIVLAVLFLWYDPNILTGDPFARVRFLQFIFAPLGEFFDQFRQSPGDPLVNLPLATIFSEIVNVLALLLFSILTWFFAVIFNRFEFFRAKYYAPLNNMTIANIAGYCAAAMPFVLGAIAFLNFQRNVLWLDISRGFPWFLCVMPIIYLGMIAQRRDKIKDAPEEGVVLPEPNAKLSLKAYFKSLTSAKSASPHISDWLSVSRHARVDEAFSENIRGDVEKLMRGDGLYFSGMSDAGLYTLLSESIASAQDRGQVTLIVCPDGAAKEVITRLNQLSRFGFPEVTRRQAIWSITPDEFDDYDPGIYYDLIIAEETSFHRHVDDTRSSLDNISHRLALITLLDFHLIDACRFYLSLRILANQDLPEKVSLLVQALDHIGIETQLNKLVSYLPGGAKTISECAMPPIPAEFGWIVWLAGKPFRKRLLANAGFEDSNANLMTAPYLALIPKNSKPEENFSRAFQATRHQISDYRELEDSLRIVRGEIERPEGNFYPTKQYFHFSPGNDVRIITRPDPGNLSQCFSGLNPFWGNAPDYLLHITSSGYPGRQYMLDQINNIKLTRGNIKNELEHLKPMAQTLGIGILEIAEQIGNSMHESDGMSEETARTLLGLSAGKVGDYINVTPSKRGLARLFKIVDPEFHKPITTVLDERLREQYLLGGGGTFFSFDSSVDVVNVDSPDLSLGKLAYKDEGLTFHRGGTVFLDREFVKIINPDRTNNRITGSSPGRGNLELHPQPVYYYKRHYKILLTEKLDDKEFISTFVGENVIAHATSTGATYEIALFQASINRLATRRFELSSDDEPLAGMKPENGALAMRPEHRRPFRNVFFFAVNEADRNYANNPVLNRTLAASLQTVIGLAFPSLRQRISVVSLNNGVDNEREEHCEANDLALGLFPTGELVGLNIVELVNKFYEIGEKKIKELPIESLDKMVGVAIIEDSDHDLGIARTTFDAWNSVLRRWYNFLMWASERPEWNKENLFDAKSAAEFVAYLQATETASGRGRQ